MALDFVPGDEENPVPVAVATELLALGPIPSAEEHIRHKVIAIIFIALSVDEPVHGPYEEFVDFPECGCIVSRKGHHLSYLGIKQQKQKYMLFRFPGDAGEPTEEERTSLALRSCSLRERLQQRSGARFWSRTECGQPERQGVLVRDRGLSNLKGFDEPVRAWSVEWE